jgi:imidazole glycerol phosphate synthase subunit HisF
MTTRVFSVLFLSIICFSLRAETSATLNLTARVYPQVQINVINTTSSGNTDDKSPFFIRSNMDASAYKVFYRRESLGKRSQAQIKHRQLIVEAN